jgi:hypothetical protein
MENEEKKPTELFASPEVQIKILAKADLQRTDYVVFKCIEKQLVLNSSWLAWREQLREVTRGNATEIPPEPPRYASSPQPQDPSTPPPEVLAEAQPDESLVELKARLLGEFASLRNMLIGHIPMNEEQLLRLQALEHPKFQTWLQG